VYGADQFHENGFCVIGNFVGTEDIENLRLVRGREILCFCYRNIESQC